jgi:hypothetical protein
LLAFNPFPKISVPDFTDLPKDFWAYSDILEVYNDFHSIPDYAGKAVASKLE